MLTARTGATDRMLIFGVRHLRLVLAEYAAHYNGRSPIAVANSARCCPITLPPTFSRERIKLRPVLGGLFNEYERAA